MSEAAAGDPVILTINELDNHRNAPMSMAYKLVQEGMLPGQKVGSHWRFRRGAIDRWLEQGPVNFAHKCRTER